MNLIKLEKDNVINGRGIRLVVWESYCPHHCEKCHNPETWVENCPGSHKFSMDDMDEILKELSKPYYDGITFTGGDPLADKNRHETLDIIRKIKKDLPEKTVWIWTGFRFEELMNDPEFGECLPLIEIIIDGKFDWKQREKDIKDPNFMNLLKYRGSSNQRIIHASECKDGKMVIEML